MHAVQDEASFVAFAAYLDRFAEDLALMSLSGTGMPMVLDHSASRTLGFHRLWTVLLHRLVRRVWMARALLVCSAERGPGGPRGSPAARFVLRKRVLRVAGILVRRCLWSPRKRVFAWPSQWTSPSGL